MKIWCRPAAAVICIAAAIALAGCGSSSSSKPSRENVGAGATSASSGVTAGGLSASTAQKTAEAAIKPFVGRHPPFPVTTPLKSRPKPGFTIAYMNCDSPECSLFYSLLVPAARTMGVKLVDVKAGLTASSVNAAFESVLQQKPDAIINGGDDPLLWRSALTQIKAAKIPIISIGLTDGAPYGLTTYPNDVDSGVATFTLNGKLEADWIYARKGAKANIDYAWIPELSFSAIIRSAFIAEMHKLCPGCSVRSVQVPVADLGTKAPQDVISDLQQHPSVNTLSVSASSILVGMPSALREAGISNLTTVGNGGLPVNFQDLKAGQQTVDLAADFPVAVWELVDEAVRAAERQPFDSAEKNGIPVEQFLAQKDITFDTSRGWTAFPDFAARFAKLWGK